MNYTIILIEAIVMVAIFTAMILIPLVKNPVWYLQLAQFLYIFL